MPPQLLHRLFRPGGLAAALFLAPAVVAGALTWSPDGAAGGAGVWDTETANWHDGAGPVAFVRGSDLEFPAPPGRVEVAGVIEAGELRFLDDNYELVLNNQSGSRLDIAGLEGGAGVWFQGDIAAGANAYPPASRFAETGLRFHPEGVRLFTGGLVSLLGGSPVLGVRGEAGRLDFAGKWFSDAGSIHSWLLLQDGGHLVLTAEADMRFIKEEFYTLQLWVTGDGTGTLELAEGFVADRTEGGQVRRGIGSIRMGGGTLISHRSANLPLGYRPRADGSKQTNGHLVFENQAGSRWIVRGSEQVYPGAVWIHQDMEVVTEADLMHVGVTESGPGYTAFNGWSVLRPVSLRKSGAGALVLAGEQSYAAGASLSVDEGMLGMRSDPAGGLAQGGGVTGAQLNLTIAEGARLEWQADGALQRLIMRGEMLLAGKLRLAGATSHRFGATSRTELLLHADAAAPMIEAAGSLITGGVLQVGRLPGYFPVEGTEWILCSAGSLSNSWTLEDRTGLGLEMQQDGGVLKLVATGGAPDLPGAVVLEDLFEAPSDAWQDLSTVPLWGSPPASGSAFEWVDGVVRLRRSGDRDTTGYTRYSNSDGLKTFTALDHRFAAPVAHAASEVSVDFRLRWPVTTDGSGEGGRVLILLNHDYPEGGLDLTPEGVVDSRYNDFSAQWWARPAYHVRLRNGTTRAGSSFLQYGGGHVDAGEYEAAGGWWLPGFVSGAGQVAPGAGDDFPANSWVRTREGMASDRFTTFRYRILPDRQELWRDDNDDGLLSDDELKAVMPLPAESEAPLYRYFEHFEGIRVFWSGNIDGGGGDSGQMELDWLRVTVQDNLSPVADAGPDVSVEALVEGRAPVPLDAGASFDPEGDPLLYVWSIDGQPVHMSRQPAARVELPIGEHLLELLVIDPAGNHGVDTVAVTVTDGPARPVANPGPERSVTAANPWFGLADLSAAASYSLNGDIVHYRWSVGSPARVLAEGAHPQATVALGIGSHQVRLTVWDEAGLFTEASVRVIVEPIDSGDPDEAIYRENFSRTESGGEMGPWEVGWNLTRYDGEPVASVKYDGNAHRSLSWKNPGGSAPYLPKINADPDGTEFDAPGAGGHMWMNQMPFINVSPGEWMLWTDEFAVDQSQWDLTRITFHSTDSSPEHVKASPAVRIGEQWYIGWDLRVTTPYNWWRSFTIQLDRNGWYLFEPSALFSIRDAAPAGRLPDGEISAFGIYFFKDFAWYINQIDNFTLWATPRKERDPYGDWIFENFPQSALVGAGAEDNFAPEADPDANGWANIWEYAMGRDPLGATGLAPLPLVRIPESEAILALPWNPEARNVVVSVYESTDLAEWTRVEAVVVDTTELESGLTWRQWHLPGAGGNRFFRMEAGFSSGMQ